MVDRNWRYYARMRKEIVHVRLLYFFEVVINVKHYTEDVI